jgi:hypothetical protein
MVQNCSSRVRQKMRSEGPFYFNLRDEIYLSTYNALPETMPLSDQAPLNRRFLGTFTIRLEKYKISTANLNTTANKLNAKMPSVLFLVPNTRTCRITHPTQISYDMWKIATFQITRPFSSKSGGSSGHGSPAVMWNSVTKAVEKYCANRTVLSRVKTAKVGGFPSGLKSALK